MGVICSALRDGNLRSGLRTQVWKINKMEDFWDMALVRMCTWGHVDMCTWGHVDVCTWGHVDVCTWGHVHKIFGVALSWAG